MKIRATKKWEVIDDMGEKPVTTFHIVSANIDLEPDQLNDEVMDRVFAELK